MVIIKVKNTTFQLKTLICEHNTTITIQKLKILAPNSMLICMLQLVTTFKFYT